MIYFKISSCLFLDDHYSLYVLIYSSYIVLCKVILRPESDRVLILECQASRKAPDTEERCHLLRTEVV